MQYQHVLDRLNQLVRRLYKWYSTDIRPTPRGSFLYITTENATDGTWVKIYNAYEYKTVLKDSGFIFDGEAWIGYPEYLLNMPYDVLERIILSTYRDCVLKLANRISDYVAGIKSDAYAGN